MESEALVWNSSFCQCGSFEHRGIKPFEIITLRCIIGHQTCTLQNNSILIWAYILSCILELACMTVPVLRVLGSEQFPLGHQGSELHCMTMIQDRFGFMFNIHLFNPVQGPNLFWALQFVENWRQAYVLQVDL